MKYTECLLDSILMIGYDMLVAGAEVGRVENQIERMCHIYEMEEVEVFIITSSVIVSVKDRDGFLYTQTKRIKGYHTDFYKIELLEQLTEKICQSYITGVMIEEERAKIEKKVQAEHGWKSNYVSYGIFCMVSMIFTLFFGGTFCEGMAAFLCGIIIKSTMFFLEKMVSNRFVINVTVSVLGGFAAWICYQIGFVVSVDKVIIGNIMLLIPGLAMVNAFKDLISGDMITGLLRLADSLVQAVAIAIGFALILFPMGV